MAISPEQLKPEETKKETERPPEAVEEVEKLPETPEGLSEFGEETVKRIEETSREAVDSGSQQIEKAVASIGGELGDIEAGKVALEPVQKEMSDSAAEAQAEIQKIAEVETTAGLKDTYTPEQLAELRAKTKEDYGGGLVGKKNENLFQFLSKEKDLSGEDKHLFELTKWQRVREFQERIKDLEKDLAKLQKKEQPTDKDKQEMAKKQKEMDEKRMWLSENESRYKEPISLRDKELLTQKSQEYAYKLLDKKIEAGVVKPDSITSDMLSRLELRDKPEITVENIEQIAEQIASELKELTEKGFIKEDEARLIQAEAEKFAKIYAEAFPDADPQQIFEVTRDNARKLAYQTERDKQVFSGSDHGTRHILEGNMRMADRMIESLGDRVSAKDKVLIHQIIIDHDLGYTVGVAQAKESFDASKDHPLFSTKFIEANQEYYKKMFGEDGYKMIRDGILMHSYPKSEYDTPTDPEKGFNPDIVRSITSTVDALGVTAETKCPAFFRSPEVVRVLQKVKLYADTHEGKVAPEALAMYKDQLRAIADKEPDAARREGFYSAIENQFNPVTVEMTLGQYVGVLKDIKMTKREGKMVPHVSMDISRVQALLGDLFGDKAATKAFMKAMEDFGISKDVMADMAKVIRQIREAGTDEEKRALVERLKYESSKAVFEFAPEFAEITPEIEKTFEELERISIRNEIRDLARKLESPEAQTPENVNALLLKFRKAIREQADEEDLVKIMQIQERILTNIGNPAEFSKALKEFNTFTTKREKEFMGF